MLWLIVNFSKTIEMFRGIFPVVIFLHFAIFLKAQHPEKTISTSTNVYKIYEEQVEFLLEARGVPGPEIMAMIDIIKTNKINSDEALAELLGKLYSSKKGIGIIFYFFNGDSLRRVFFEPGKIIEKKTIFIKKKELLQLSIDFNHTLGLYDLSKNRAPKQRGLIVKPPPSSGQTYEGIIKKATALLIPESFDKSYKDLLIIPALNIGTIPFHLLKPYKDSTLLIENCSFTIVPGLIDLFTLRIKALKRATQWMGGDMSKTFDNNDSINELDSTSFSFDNPLFISNPAYPSNTKFEFPDLPGAKREIDSAIKYVKHYILLEGKKATKNSVLKDLDKSDVAYFATHGIADAEKPMEKSFLVLSGADPFLTAKDIMEYSRKNKSFPEMVILSACQTGLGKSMEAGVAGLARSFLLAGSNHVIMSLWNVDDNATAYLMSRFMFHLQEKHQFIPSEPLRLAILDTKKIYPKPSQWASFSLFGIDY